MNMTERRSQRHPQTCMFCHGQGHTVVNCSDVKKDFLFFEFAWLYDWYGKEFVIRNLLNLFNFKDQSALLYHPHFKAVNIRSYTATVELPSTVHMNKKDATIVERLCKKIERIHNLRYTQNLTDHFIPTCTAYFNHRHVGRRMFETKIIADSTEHGPITTDDMLDERNPFLFQRISRFESYMKDLEEDRNHGSMFINDLWDDYPSSPEPDYPTPIDETESNVCFVINDIPDECVGTDVECPICYDSIPFYKSLKIKGCCIYSYCEPCFSKHYFENKHKHECMMCRKEFNTVDVYMYEKN